MKHLLTIAGSDSSGGAGIQADLKTFAAHGTFGMSVITAVTAQNTQGVTMVQDIDAGVIEAQIDAVFDDIRVDAVKIGMVSRPEIIKTIADRLRYYKPQIVVLDPVMISKSGYPEAEVISGMKVTMKEEMRPVAERILELGAKAVLVKGGHLNGSADDLLFDGSTERWFMGDRIDTKNTHGTGCTLSSSLAANLAQGLSLADAVAASKAYVTEAIEYSLPIGGGCGPTHHFVDLYRKAGWLK